MTPVPPTNESTAPTPLSPRAVLVVFSGLMLGALLASLDQTIVATALPTIVRDLGGAQHLSWVVTGYLLATTVVTPLWGKLGDLFGRKSMFQICIVIFLVGSALCGLANTMLALVLFRALQGVGGGGLMVLAQAIIGDIVAPRDRGRYQGIFGAVFGVSSVAGPLLGGFFVDHLSWRWVFYVNLPIGLLALVVTSIVLPASVRRSVVRIDYLGIALLTATLSCLVLYTSFGAGWGWLSARGLTLLVVALVALMLFVVVERRAADPVLPLRLFRLGVFVNAAAIAFTVGFAMLGSLTFMPTYLQVVHGQSPTMSGLHMLPLMLGLLTTSTVSGFLISRYGRYKRFPVMGTALFTIGLVLFSRMDATTSLWTVSLYMLVFGLGLGMVMQVLTIAVQNVVAYEDLGTATSGVSLFRSIGSSFGVALFGALYASRLEDQLRTGASVVEANVDAIQLVFLSAVPVGVVAFVLASAMKERPLRTGAVETDPADTLGVLRMATSREEMARALSNVLRREGVERIYARLAEQAGLPLSPHATWMLARVERRAAAREPGTLAPTRAQVPARFGPLLDELEAGGYISTATGPIVLTRAGDAALDDLVIARARSLRELLVDWEPERHHQLGELINELAGQMLGDEADKKVSASTRPAAPSP